MGDFVRTVCERTRSVRFLMTSRLRSIANEHSVELRSNEGASAVMFLRRLPRSDLASFSVTRFKRSGLSALVTRKTVAVSRAPLSEVAEQENDAGGGIGKK